MPILSKRAWWWEPGMYYRQPLARITSSSATQKESVCLESKAPQGTSRRKAVGCPSLQKARLLPYLGVGHGLAPVFLMGIGQPETRGKHPRIKNVRIHLVSWKVDRMTLSNRNRLPSTTTLLNSRLGRENPELPRIRRLGRIQFAGLTVGFSLPVYLISLMLYLLARQQLTLSQFDLVR